MKILLVIHGYPMRYNAGSEVYTQSLAQALADRHEVHVFTRQQNKFLPDYVLTEDLKCLNFTHQVWHQYVILLELTISNLLVKLPIQDAI